MLSSPRTNLLLHLHCFHPCRPVAKLEILVTFSSVFPVPLALCWLPRPTDYTEFLLSPDSAWSLFSRPSPWLSFPEGVPFICQFKETPWPPSACRRKPKLAWPDIACLDGSVSTARPPQECSSCPRAAPTLSPETSSTLTSPPRARDPPSPHCGTTEYSLYRLLLPSTRQWTPCSFPRREPGLGLNPHQLKVCRLDR